MRHIPVLTLMLLGWFAIPAQAQVPPIKNPSAVAFTCPNHATDDGHEIDIVREVDGVIVDTLPSGDPPEDPTTGEVEVAINVMPIAFGEYRVVVRALAGTLSSPDSLLSDLWERVPGRPSGVVVR